MKPMYEKIYQKAAEEGLEHGMHMVVSSNLQTENLHLDPKDTMSI